MQRILQLCLVLAAVLLAAGVAGASPRIDASVNANAPAFRLAPLPGLRFTSPVWVGGAGDGTSALYVVEQRGLVWRVAAGRATRFLDLRASVAGGGELGLLSIAFARDYRTSGRLFAWFTTRGGAVGEVRQLRVRDARVVAGSGRTIIRVPLAPPTATNHNGGMLWSMPGGHLLLSVGDGGGAGDPAGNAQRLDRLTGKLLRITPRLGGGYAIPRDNPFVGRSGARGEVFALGLRNPWRFSVDAPTGDIWIGDVGQDSREEVDRLRAGAPAGANFGWRRLEGDELYDEGTQLTSGTTYGAPFLSYGHDAGACSVTGGVVYRGPITALRGWYLHADWCTDEVRAVRPATGSSITRAGVGGIAHFGAGPGGNVYVASQQTGRIYRVVAA